MAYNYAELKPQLLTDSGQIEFIQRRDSVLQRLKLSGAIRMQEAMRGWSGDSWMMLATMDRMVELGDIVEVPNAVSSAGQHRVFVIAKEV